MSNKSEILVSLDIGSNKILVIVAEKTTDGLRVLGYSNKPSLGIKQGVVVHMDATVEAISEAIKEATLVSDVKIDEVNVGISGTHIIAKESTGRVSISHNEVDKEDIKRVLISAEAVIVGANEEILHVLPKNYTIDSKTSVDIPLGMHGDVLEVKTHVVIGDSSAIKNVLKSVGQCGLKINDIVLKTLAASQATLTKDEKNLGVCLVDMGGGLTDVSVFINGSIQHTNVLPIAGNLVTNDIVHVYTTSYDDAEELKQKHGCALAELVKDDELLEIKHISDAQMKKLSKRT